MSYHTFGQTGIAIVGTAVAQVGIDAYHAVKTSKLQRGFQKKLDTDAARVDYIKSIVLRFKSLGLRLATGGRYRPGTKEFETILAKALTKDMNYKGLCNANIYVPGTKVPRDVWASISRGGYIKPPTTLPPDVGPIWAGGCKNAQDEFRMIFIKKFKGTRKFEHFKVHKEDIGTINLFMKFGMALIILVVLLMMLKIQRAVIKEQQRP